MNDALPAIAAVLVAFAVGSIPFSQIVARGAGGVDLRAFGNGTVSGSGVGKAVGFWAMVAAGLLDIAKGAVAVLPLAGSRPVVAAIAAGAAVAGHNWSPWLGWAGGRGIGPAIGACGILAWPGSVVLLAGLGIGKALRRTAVGSFISQAVLPVVTALTHGTAGLVLGIALLVPMWSKRVVGNRPPQRWTVGALLFRLVTDHDRSDD